MKRIGVFLITLAVSLAMQAYDVVVGDIAYNLTSKVKTAEVTAGDEPYTGEIVIPSTINANGAKYKVTVIGQEAFRECEGLTKVTIQENVESIELRAFYFCENLTDVTLPNSLKYIKDSAFHGCVSLKSVTFPDQLETIGSNAFHYCYELKSIVIPESVTTIGTYAFEQCKGLTSVTLPENMTYLGYVFGNCTSLKNVSSSQCDLLTDKKEFL